MTTIQDDLDLAQQTAERAQSHLPVLLHKDLEQTVAIQNLSQRARRIDAGLNIASLISAQPTQSALLHTLGEEILARMEFDLVLVAVPTPGGLSLVHTFGNLPPEVNPTVLLGQRNPLRQCLQAGEIMLVSNLSENEDWHNTPLLRASGNPQLRMPAGIRFPRAFDCRPPASLPVKPARQPPQRF